jgi:Family of unknown function (DUF6510)
MTRGRSWTSTSSTATWPAVSWAPGKCAHCGTVSMVGAMRAYVRAPGTVLRCPTCEGVVLRIVETDDATYLDLRGVVYLRITRG